MQPITRSDEFLAYQIDRLIEEQKNTQILLSKVLDIITPKPAQTLELVLEKKEEVEEKPAPRTRRTAKKE